MKLTRRRFLTISASFAAFPAHANSWQGRAFGADVSITINGPSDLAKPALAEARRTIREIEQLFSLYDPASSLSRLNNSGALVDPGRRFLALMRASDDAYRITGGLFDPTVQPLWHALAEGRDLTAAQVAIGWERVSFDTDRITLDAGQSLTFNGIAQGFATDLVVDALTRSGLTNTLVNIGEYRGVGGPWSIGLSDPDHGYFGSRALSTGAVATSSPSALSLGSQAHILHPTARPQWSTVSVEAETATMADALSTALVLAPRNMVGSIARAAGLRRVTLVTFDGDLTTI
ncbi:thiamine biosynthesis lipoprotein [Litoreibacter halocynthiae]|uniref:FAD:protein FMN transferase n=1 Tax=Litoreibacter halocynthiae TaxID=1242689 RepID=A0A4R7LNR5_9RHOB|nr:FAD:protein FMN transferase [Litoreibacter halocynthiae]TDT77384.1 thiamine biosynthesis lipoprotein [Litoreibacter halocynthiae]